LGGEEDSALPVRRKQPGDHLWDAKSGIVQNLPGLEAT
jgi:hypothetical protein